MLKDAGSVGEKVRIRAYPRYRSPWHKDVKIWLLILILCLAAAGAALGIKYLWEAVYAAKAPGNLLQQDMRPGGMKDGPTQKR